jgi:hypothetical protein
MGRASTSGFLTWQVRELMGSAKASAGAAPEARIADSEGSAASPPPPGQAPADAAPTSTAEQSASSATFNPLTMLLSSNEKTRHWLDNPRVMAALGEVHQKPWKTVKYVLDKEVMAAFADLKNLMRGKAP